VVDKLVEMQIQLLQCCYVFLEIRIDDK